MSRIALEYEAACNFPPTWTPVSLSVRFAPSTVAREERERDWKLDPTIPPSPRVWIRDPDREFAPNESIAIKSDCSWFFDSVEFDFRIDLAVR